MAIDERARITRLGEASCRNLRWFFDICAESHIDPQQLVRDIPYTFEHLNDPSGFIDWQSYCTFVTNFGGFLSVDELADFARITSYPRTTRLWLAALRQFYSITELSDLHFGEQSAIRTLYPCQTRLTARAAGSFRIDLTMRDGYPPSEAFNYMLKGQIAGLPSALGSPVHEVRMQPTERGASYFVTFEERSGAFVALRQALSKPLFTLYSRARSMRHYRQLRQHNAALSQEVAALKQSEAVALETESRYRLLATHGKDVIWTLSRDLRFQFVSPSIEKLTGYKVDEAVGLSLEDLLTPASWTRVVERVTEQLNRRDNLEGAEVSELEVVHRDGSRRWIENTARFILDPIGEPVSIVGISRNITERKRMELELQEREESYRAITTTARDGIITVDDHARITFANPAVSSLLGYPENELTGRKLTELIPDLAHLLPVSAQAEVEPLSGLSVNAECKDGTIVPIEVSFAEHRLRGRRFLTGILRDITQRQRIELERQELEHQLLASQKMESIGQLTGGIAHDFNNLLVAILGYADLASARNIAEQDLAVYLGEIKQAGQRAADMTQKLLAFSRRQIIEPTLIDLNELILGIDLMIRRLIPENIEISIVPGAEAGSVLADPGQLEQVIVNLAVNARDAMPYGGRLAISTEQVTIDGAFVHANPWAQTGDFLRLQVHDTGYGMNEDVLKRVFEPFFTTKPEGSGTGLGLAVVFGIVKQHNGFINVTSETGRGTRFNIYLPVAQTRSLAQTREGHRAAAGGNETILIVEDNQQVSELARLILRGGGYQTLSAQDGQEALDVFAAKRAEIDLVLMDVVMPRIGGKEVMERMRRVDPDVRILFTSGYSNSGIHTNFILEEGLEFIPKPYSTNSLRGKVRSILDRPPGDTGGVSVARHA